jgi:hypothetical protein
LPRIKVGDYTLKEDAIVVDARTPLPTDVDFQNPIALFSMELRSQTTTTFTCRDLYYTEKEIKDEVPEIEDGGGTDSEDETIDCPDTDSEDDFNPESNKENLRDMNIRD